MALAILEFLESYGQKSRFRVNLGTTNRFYCYKIGDQQIHNNGLTLLQDPIYTSPLIGPLPESSLGRTVLEVPNDKFDRQHRAIQIISFQNAKKIGPAISEVVIVPSVSTNDLPEISFGQELDRQTTMNKSSVETVAFQYREVPPVSEAMGILDMLTGAVSKVLPTLLGGGSGGGSIGNLLSTLLPKLLGMLPQLMGGGGKIDLAGGQPAGDVSQIANLLGGLLQQSGTETPTAPTPTTTLLPPSPSAATPTTVPPSPRPIMQRAPVARRNSSSLVAAKSMAMSVQDYYAPRYGGVVNGFALSTEDDLDDDLNISSASTYSMPLEYSEAMVFPAALMAILPTILQVAPQIIDLIMKMFPKNQNPTSKQMSMMLGIDEEEYTEDHATLIALSLGIAAAPTLNLAYQRVDAVILAFTDVTPVMIHGKSRFLYRHDQDISFPLKLETPQAVKKAKLQLLVKHPNTLKVLIEQNYHIENATSGAVSVVPKISKEQLKKLAVNEEYLICVSLVWEGRSKKTQKVMQLGTSTMQLITLVGEYLFDRVEGTGQTVPLNDVDRFRSYWHKVWQGDFTEDVRRISFDCKYYYTLESKRTENARMETVTQLLEDDATGHKSRLKSGLIVSPYGLNELLEQISQHPRLSDAELTALVGSEFKARFSHAARTQVNFKGKPRDTVALWIYPELKLQQVILKQVEQSQPNGNVQALKEHPVYFPMPALAHFIGVST